MEAVPKMDADTEVFLSNFDETPGSRIVEVGANEEDAANTLAERGYDVLGIDLRPYLQAEPCKHRRLEGDFCKLAATLEDVDSVFSLSAIEHFGMETYEPYDVGYQPYYDVIAMHHIWNILKPGGTCYITVPYGKFNVECRPHWRIYNSKELQARIVQQFTIEAFAFFTSGESKWGELLIPSHRPVPQEMADSYLGCDPHVTVFLKLRKPA